MQVKVFFLIPLLIAICSMNDHFIGDGYHVPKEMLKNSSHSIESKDLVSYDKSWLSNDSLGETLVFDVYTDYYTLNSFHFLNEEMPPALLEKMELHLKSGEIATTEQKNISIGGLISKATKINSSFFVTQKGLKLGDAKQKITAMYGNPDRTSVSKGIEACEWTSSNSTRKSSSLEDNMASGDLGSRTTMFFKFDQLIAIVFQYEAP
jgi:hypothetical protein